jgi:creatinine amidohydrolase
MVTLMTHTRLHRLDEITLTGMRSLDRQRTAVLLPVGMVEEHGNHLPLGTDNYAVEALALAAASWLLENDRQLHVLLLPMLPFGTDAVDSRREDLFQQAGSVWISAATLKALVADIVSHLIRYGFRYIFPMSFHGGAGQHVALDELCAEMREQSPGLVMHEPCGYVMAGAALDVTPGLATLLGRPLTTQEEVALKGSIHASMFETSLMLHLRPELVDPSYRALRTLEWHQLYNMKDWPGYVGAGPSHANAEVGGAMLRWRGVRAGALIRRAMDGEDLSHLPRHPAWLSNDAEADSVSEAPREGELEAARDPFIDSKPAMMIPRDKLAKLHAEAMAAQAGAEVDTDEGHSPTQGDSDAGAEATRPSSTSRTPPHPSTPDVNESGDAS